MQLPDCHVANLLLQSLKSACRRWVMFSENDTLLSGCYLLLGGSLQNPRKFKIQSCHWHLALLDLLMSEGTGRKMNIYIYTHTHIYALKTARNYPKETEEVLVCFKVFVPPSLFSLSFPYFVSDPQLDLEYRSVSLEGSWIIKGHSIYHHSFI